MSAHRGRRGPGKAVFMTGSLSCSALAYATGRTQLVAGVRDDQALDPRVVEASNRVRRGGALRTRDLRSALLGDDPQDRQLAMAYQPIVRTADDELVGVEALLRWTHPVRGTVQALTAISIAERTGMMVELGAWVLDRGCRDHAARCAQHPSRRLSLSVNVSVRQLAQPHYVDAVAATVADTGMDPTLLILEVTESIFVDEADRAARVLDQLRALGVRVALDDFGTGYSSLSYLRRFPVDVLKIDRQFTTGIGTDPTDTAIVIAITQLARALDMQVTAEGVETRVQRDALSGIGCQSAQGFL